MQIKQKILLFFIIFFAIIIFNNLKSFAVNVVDPSQQAIDYIENYIDNTEYDSYIGISAPTYTGSPYIGVTVFLYNSSKSFIVNGYYGDNYDYSKYYFVHDLSKNNISYYQLKFSYNSNYPDYITLSDNGCYSYNIVDEHSSGYYVNAPGYGCSSASNIYNQSNQGILYNHAYMSLENTNNQNYYANSSFLTGVYDPSSTQINPINKEVLYKLYLADNNFNSLPVHEFDLMTFENFAYYDEIKDLYNTHKNYCIYITDYTRFLTYQSKNVSAPIVYGSYVLTGYIDFLVSDTAYFYYDSYRNSIRACSGDYTYGNVTNYVKRVFFSLVYSKDSNNPQFTISSDNGMLWCTHTEKQDFTSGVNLYFVGSNQTIFYCNYTGSSKNFNGLSNNVYYRGCSDSKFYEKYNSQVYEGNMSNRGSDSHNYYFGFNGGSTKCYYLDDNNYNNNTSNDNQTIQDYNNDINNYIDDDDNNDFPDIYNDSSDGNSYIVPSDDTSKTYDDNNNEEDSRPVFYFDEEKIDTYHWNIIDLLRGIFNNTLTISDAVNNLKGNVSNSYNNFTTNITNSVEVLITPDFELIHSEIENINTEAEEHLGIVYQPFSFLIYIFTQFSNLGETQVTSSNLDTNLGTNLNSKLGVSNNNISFNLPTLEYGGVTLLQGRSFSFTQLFNDAPILYNIHQIYLTAVDFIIIGLLLNYAYHLFKEVFTK